jgi:hypothetical protein
MMRIKMYLKRYCQPGILNINTRSGCRQCRFAITAKGPVTSLIFGTASVYRKPLYKPVQHMGN